MNNRPSVEQVLEILLLPIASDSDDFRDIKRSYFLWLEGIPIRYIDRPLHRPVRNVLLRQNDKLIKATNKAKVKPVM